MRHLIRLAKARFRTFELLPVYFRAIVFRWHDVLWGAGLLAVAFVLWWFLGTPSVRIIAWYLVAVMFIAGYYVWREEYARLIPKLTVLDKIRYHPTPTQDGGMSVWIQLFPKCLTEAPIEECSAWLREVRVWSPKDQKWKPTDMNETLPLGWSFGDEKHLPITLQPGNEKRLNVLTVHSSNKILIPLTYPLPLLWTTFIYNNTDIFLFDITIRGKDCPPVDRYLTVQVGAEWDKPIVKFISKPGALSLLA